MRRTISSPITVWLRITCHSAAFSWPRLPRMWSGITLLPTSCSQPPIRQRITIASLSPSRVAIAADRSATCWQCSAGMPSRTDAAIASACARRIASGSSATKSSTVRSPYSRTWSRPRRFAE